MGSKKSKKQAQRRNPASPAKKKSGGSAIRGSVLAIIALVVAAVGIGAGVGIWKLTSDSVAEKSSIKAKFPPFVYAPGTPKGTLVAYQGAVDYFDDFSHIPCFCGCGKGSGHKSVRDCFIKSKDGDNISYDNHGAG